MAPLEPRTARVLVVDDSEMNRDLLGRRLQRNGHVVEAVESGQHALDIMAAQRFDLVMLDIMMPDMDGYMVLERIKADAALTAIPVIMISALGDTASVVRSLSLGADDYINKPFDPLILRARVDAALAKKRLHDEEQRYTRSMERELELGRAIQAGFLPSELPQPAGWEIAARFRPARQVAGDFYDSFVVPGCGIAVLIADVCDKGVGAALYMALFRSLLRASATHQHAEGTEAREILHQAVRSTNDYIASVHDRANMFATVFFGILEPCSGRLDYVNAGHDAPLVIGQDGIRQELRPTAPALGLMTACQIEVARVDLETNEVLFAYTDGVIDETDARQEAFGEARLRQLLIQPHASADAMLACVEQGLETHNAGLDPFDDTSMLALRRIG